MFLRFKVQALIRFPPPDLSLRKYYDSFYGMLKIYSQTYDCKELSRITTLLRWYIVTISHVGCVTHGLTHCKLQTWNERHTPSSSGRIIPDWISSYCLSWKSQLGTSCGIKAHNFLFLRPWKVFAHSLVVIDVTGYQVSTNYKLMMSYCKFTCYCFFFNHKNIISILRNLLVESITASGLLLDPRRPLLLGSICNSCNVLTFLKRKY